MSTPRISVVVCTHNNAEYLKLTLESLERQTLGQGEFEVVVVDNASTDATAEVAALHPSMRYLREDRLGLSVARNAGIRASRAPVVAFIDDDAEAESGWLAALLEGYQAHGDAWAVGGKALPVWGGPVPEWLTEKYHRSLSLIDWGEEMRPLAWPERVIGVNCSFRKEVFEEFGLFDECLGRIGQALLGHEDTEIQERIHASGHQVVYVPSAVVNHHVPASRMTREYFDRRSKGTMTSERIMELKNAKQEREACDMAAKVRDEQTEAL
jgi:glycosyltransferase involved in cell wall biosynthesis